MKVLGIIGQPIAHSMSPVMFRAALTHYGLNISYNAWEIPPNDLAEFIAYVRNPRSTVIGFNVTVPHKETIMSYVDIISREAERARAVNTVIIRDGILYGYNTDGPGFVRALKEELGYCLESKKALILGAGGAARGIVAALLKHDLRAITIANRTIERSQKLISDLNTYCGGDLRSIGLADDILKEVAADADMIVNCTTVGMRHGPSPNGNLIAGLYISRKALIYDLVYNPPETPIMKEARAVGAVVSGGLSMLVYQGAIGFEMWTDKKAPIKIMREAANEALEQN